MSRDMITTLSGILCCS